ncbi:MAG: hypothetical protein ACRD9R_10775 [Pyrinomonadaceae bacterium]
MYSLSLHPSQSKTTPPDLAAEIAQLEAVLAARREELSALQDGFRQFKQRYAQVVGSRLAELDEVEREIREAEVCRLGLEDQAGETDEGATHETGPQAQAASGKASFRKLFWTVARLFHPDHAASEAEARRRHAIMAEASRAYREGDVDSLHTLLGDEQLQSYCATAAAAGHDEEEEADLPGRLFNLKEEMRTIEFGLKRIRQDRLYQLMLKTDEEARHGRDSLASMAESIERQITKARRRLEHLS